MGLTQKLVGYHDDHSGGLITRPRAHELFANLVFLAQRTRIFDRLVAAAGAGSGNQVLDVGCGSGYFCRRKRAPAVNPNRTVVGIDPSQPMLDYATRHAPANYTFQVAGAEVLPFGDASFDLVVCSFAFHHIPVDRRADAGREAFRVLPQGARLLIAEVRPPSIPLARTLIAGGIGHAVAHNISDQLQGLITEAGFTVTGTGDMPLLRYVTAERP